MHGIPLYYREIDGTKKSPGMTIPSLLTFSFSFFLCVFFSFLCFPLFYPACTCTNSGNVICVCIHLYTYMYVIYVYDQKKFEWHFCVDSPFQTFAVEVRPLPSSLADHTSSRIVVEQEKDINVSSSV